MAVVDRKVDGGFGYKYVRRCIMHDFSLGPPVDVGGYDGPLVDGKPLHKGNCEDGTYGCRACNGAARSLSPEQLKGIGWSTTQYCDWCKKDTPVAKMNGVRPWDEPSCYYEVCDACDSKYRENMRKEFEDD